MKQPAAVLTVKNVKKKIGRRWIIKGVSFTIQPGEVFGFLGPNGSGKTTTIRMLVNLIRPTEGSIYADGISMRDNPTKALQSIGCIVENPELYSYMSGWENLEHFARMLRGVGPKRIQEVVDIVGMDNRIHDKVRTYSLGMRQRLGIAQALLGSPKLLILDEPTNGLDPQGIKEMREFIRELASTGLSVFVSSHLLNEIQLMCDRVAIISKGEVIAVGQVDELLSQADSKLVWTVDNYSMARELLSQMDGVEIVEDESYGSSGEDDPEAGVVAARLSDKQVREANRRLISAGVGIFSVVPKNPMLEELFLRLTEGEQIG